MLAGRPRGPSPATSHPFIVSDRILSRLKDALTAALAASQYRSLPIYITAVTEALRACASAASAVSEKIAEPLLLLADTFHTLNRSRNVLFPAAGAQSEPLDANLTTAHPPKKQAPSQEQATQWCDDGGIEGQDREQIVELICRSHLDDKAEDTPRGFRDL